MLRIISILLAFVFIQSLRCQVANDNPSLNSDTIKEKQELYTGIRWTNRYRNYENDQFLFTNLFINSNITVNSRTYKNIRLKYDIYSNEIITPVNLQDIIQINREAVDSFSLFYENRRYDFINLQNDSTKGLKGYVQVLYNGPTSLLTVHKKIFTPSADPSKDGTFIYSKTAYIWQGNTYLPYKTRTLYALMDEDLKLKVRDFMRHLKTKVTRKNPENIIPVLRYYDNLRKSDED
jgi:hypothetical protein